MMSDAFALRIALSVVCLFASNKSAIAHHEPRTIKMYTSKSEEHICFDQNSCHLFGDMLIRTYAHAHGNYISSYLKRETADHRHPNHLEILCVAKV